MARRLTFALSVLCFVATAVADDEFAFEAEDADTFEFPMAVQEDEDASGGAYISSPAGRAGWAEYEIEIPEAEDYFMWGMVKELDGVSDSFFITFDADDRGDDNDVNENTWDLGGAPLLWEWDAVSGRGLGGDPRKFELGAGRLLLRVWTRENNAQLDSVFMSTDENATPVPASEFEGRDRTGEPEAVRYVGQLATRWAELKTAN